MVEVRPDGAFSVNGIGLDCGTTDRTVPVALFSRLLALLAGSALADTAPVEVPHPDRVDVAALLGESHHWIGALGTVKDAVTISLSAMSGPWRISHPLPQRTDHTAVYDVLHGTWYLDTPQALG